MPSKAKSSKVHCYTCKQLQLIMPIRQVIKGKASIKYALNRKKYNEDSLTCSSVYRKL